MNADFLEKHGVQEWSHLPVWISPRAGYEGFHRVNIQKAIAAGLTSRPLAETVRDTLEWFHAWPAERPFPWRGGMEPEREREVLGAWHARDRTEPDSP